MSDGDSVQSGASSPTIDVGIDGPCITNSDELSASNHPMEISPIRTSIRTARAVGGVTAIMHNKSCDFCRAKKKKCDGLHPCSPRKPRKPYRRRGGGTAGASPRDGEMFSRPFAARNGVRGRLTLKRCSLAPSPATGLVGLEENAFLGDYFHCLGFLSFTTQSCIRETMVRILTSPAWGRRSEPHGGRGGGGGTQQHSDTATTLVDGAPYTRPGDPSMCIFWCACGLGALVQGRTAETVSSYVQMAMVTMNLFCGPDTLKSTEAWTILAYFNWRCGKVDLYKEYIERAARFLQERIDADSTSYIKAEFAEVIKGVKALKALEECMDGDKLSSFCNEDFDPPQINEYATERDIYRFVMQSCRVFVRIFQMHVHATSCEVPFDSHKGVTRRVADPDALVGGTGGQLRQGGTCTSARSGFIVGFRDEMLQKLKQCYFGFGRLEEAADRTGVRGGIGALMIHGMLTFEKAAHDNYDGVFKRLDDITEVFERYPGLCQLTSMIHRAHILSAVIMATEDPRSRPLYDKLRNVYNPMRPPGFQPLPPFEEWCGMSQICDYLYCRTIEAIILSDDLTFRSPSARARPVDTTKQQQPVYSKDSSAKEGVSIVSGTFRGYSEMYSTFENRSMTTPVATATAAMSPDVVGTGTTANHYSHGALAEGLVKTSPGPVLSGPGSPWRQDLPPVASLLLLRNVAGDVHSEMMSQELQLCKKDNQPAEYIQGQTTFVSSTGVEGATGGTTKGTAVVEKEEATALSSGLGVILTSVSERDIDALASPDWLDITHAMLTGE